MTQLTENEEITKNSYNKMAVEWSAAHSTHKFWDEDLELFQKLLPKGRLLEIGCGNGRDAQKLNAAGYEYIGTDISEGLLSEARKNNPSANFQQVSLYDLNFKKAFDGFWCSAVLVHIPKKRIDEALQSIRRNMKPSAIGFMSVKQGKGEQLEKRDEFGGAKWHFVFWQNREFKRVLTKHGFEVVSEGYKPVSKRSKWLTYHVRVK